MPCPIVSQFCVSIKDIGAAHIVDYLLILTPPKSHVINHHHF
jgi:hypothetical protein